MFRIGDFAKLGRVSGKALRIYDEIGLLKPTFVDRFTEYRYYSADQLPRLNRILALKDLGFTLEEVKALLDEPESSTRFHAMLRHKQNEVAQVLSDEQARLQRIDERLKELTQTQQQEIKMSYKIEIKNVEPQLVASAREVLPSIERLTPTLYRLFDQVFGHLMFRHGLTEKDFGLATVLYHSWDPHIEVEAVMPIIRTVPSVEHAKIYTLPGIEQAASVLHTGSLGGLHQAYHAATQWIESNGYRMAGPNREINVVFHNDVHAADNVTELQFPVMKP